MPLKKLQEKCKKSGEQDYPRQYQIDPHFPQQQQKTNQFPPKERVIPFYMITDARISNFNFWIHVMLNSNISLGDLAVYNGCSRTFWSSIIYEHFTPSYEHIYCHLPYGLNLNQFSLFEYDCCQVIQSFKYYLDNKKCDSLDFAFSLFPDLSSLFFRTWFLSWFCTDLIWILESFQMDLSLGHILDFHPSDLSTLFLW